METNKWHELSMPKCKTLDGVGVDWCDSDGRGETMETKDVKQKIKKLVKNMLRKNQGLTYCRSEKRGQGKAPRTSGKYCTVCNCRIRGENHEEGTHHNGVKVPHRRRR